MMPLINEGMLAISSSLAASILAKVTIAAALGLTGAYLARRSRAAVRHALLFAVFGVLLLLPVAAIVAPPFRIAVSTAAPQPVEFAEVAETMPPAAAEHFSVGLAPSPQPWKASPAALLLTGWIAGMALFLVPVVLGLRQVRSLRRSALPWPDGQSMVEKLALDAGIHRRVEVLLNESLPGPMTCGVFHPAIVLPQDAKTWAAEDLNRAIVHELEHVRRGDWLSQCLARTVCAAYWFHPLVWIAWRKLALEAERSCDDAVLGRSEATAYADQLVTLAQRLSVAKRPERSPLLAMANHADLAARVGAVLDSRQRRGPAGVLPVTLASAAAVLLILTMSPLTMIAAPQIAGIGPRVLQIAAPQLAVPRTIAKEVKHAAVFQVAAQVATPTPRFTSTTRLVVVDIFASDQDGKSIEGLRPSDFAITENDQAQSISLFEFQKPELTQATLVGGSGSSYYILGYYSRNSSTDGKYRHIKVSAGNDPTIRLDFRAGYYADGLFRRGGGLIDQPAPTLTPSAPPNAGLDSPPIPINRAEAGYSEEARKAKWQGTTLLSIDVDPSGAVTNVQVMRPLGLGLDEKAVQAVQQWRFQPGMKDGKPVTVHAEVEMIFRLL